MPRGNLETIFPRALVVAGIRRSIEAKDYKTAFLACRSQRVDLNILHDHDPEQFLQNVALFTDQVKKIEYIDLFLSQLRWVDLVLILCSSGNRNSWIDFRVTGMRMCRRQCTRRRYLKPR